MFLFTRTLVAEFVFSVSSLRSRRYHVCWFDLFGGGSLDVLVRMICNREFSTECVRLESRLIQILHCSSWLASAVARRLARYLLRVAPWLIVVTQSSLAFCNLTLSFSYTSAVVLRLKSLTSLAYSSSPLLPWISFSSCYKHESLLVSDCVTDFRWARRLWKTCILSVLASPL